MSEIQQLELDDVLDAHQVRMAEISVYNWGSFQNIWTAPIDPGGTMVTGETGAGKSTLIDAVQTVFVKPMETGFNIAASQEDKRDRTIMTYIRGQYGAEEDGVSEIAKFLRPGSTHSAVRVRFDSDDGRQRTLIAIFWIAGPATDLSEMHRTYVVARRDLALKEVLQAITRKQGQIQRAELEAFYENDPEVSVHAKFDSYAAEYREVLGIENHKAPALLIKAMGLKQVGNLTALIRDFVLEPGKAPEDARRAVAEFAELESVHGELQDAKQQQETLEPLEKHAETARTAREELSVITKEIDALPFYLAKQTRVLRTQQLEQATRALELARKEHETRVAEKSRASATYEEARSRYHEQGGGNIETLRQSIADAEARRAEAQTKCDQLVQVAGLLGFDTPEGEVTKDQFQRIQAEALRFLEDTKERRSRIMTAFGEAAGNLSQLSKQLDSVSLEIKQIEGRANASNVDGKYQDVRDRLVKTFGYEEQDLLFLAEMVEVPESHLHWQGAIERALGFSRLALLVPDGALTPINRYLNKSHLGLNFRVHQVDPGQRGNPNFLEDGFLRQLKWRPHPYREAAKRLLQPTDHTLVEDVDALGNHAKAMTAQGLMSQGRNRSDKNDRSRIDDRKQWFTGFDGRRRLEALNERQAELRGELESAQTVHDKVERELREFDQHCTMAEGIGALEWSALDVAHYRDTHKRLSAQLAELERGDSALAAAQRAMEDAKGVFDEADRREREADIDADRKEQGRNLIQEQIDALEARLDSHDEDPDVVQRLDARFDPLTLQDIERLAIIEQERRQSLTQIQNRHREALNKANQASTAIMGSYRSKWRAHTSNLGSAPDDMPGYLELLDGIRKERLPDLVDRFRAKMNNDVQQSLHLLHTDLENQAEAIRDRVEDVNHVLGGVEYEQGTRLQLKPRPRNLDVVRDFDGLMKRLRQQAASGNEEGHFAALKEVMAELEKATDPASRGNLRSLQLLDARYRIDFAAEKTDVATDEVLDYMHGTGGRSGGQRESFAGFIVAASLAYALTPDGGSKPHFATVFLDEAFSNTSPSMIQPVINVFKALKLHLNLITPFKAIEAGREATSAVVLVEMNKGENLSRLRHITWRQLDAKVEEKEAQERRAAPGVSAQVDTALQAAVPVT